MGDVSKVMVDNFSLALAHGLLLYAAWRLLWRPDLDRDGAPTDEKRGWGRKAGRGRDA
jgi:hypothetical protein